MQFNIRKIDTYFDEVAELFLDPLPGERILVGEHFVVCADGDPILAHGHRLRIEASVRVEAFDVHEEVSTEHPGTRLTVAKIAPFEMAVMFEATSRALYDQLALADAKQVTVDVDLNGYEARDCGPGTFQFVVPDDEPDTVDYLLVKSTTVTVEQPAFVAA